MNSIDLPIKVTPQHCLILLLTAAFLANAEPKLARLEVRTLTPLSSRKSQAHELPVVAVSMKPLLRGDEVLIPAHSLLLGRVERAHGVGVGLRRERSSLQVEFTHWRTPAGELIPLETKLLKIDNAREQVDSRGRIQGILAASNPLSVTRGMWYQPITRLFGSSAGLVGSSGTTWAKLALGPEGAAGLFVARLLLTPMPEPEIDLPAGTEMSLHIECSAAEEKSWGSIASADPLSPALTQYLTQQPAQVANGSRKPVADVINLALIGDAESVEASFRAAGWTGADTLTRKSFRRAYTAFTQRTGYAEAPVSKLFYDRRLPDLVFQKSLNSIAKRHHIRLWRVEGPSGEEIWLGAATHDITIGFDRTSFGLLHKIDLNVDTERSKVITDLDFARATGGFTYVNRRLSDGGQAQTDGALAVAFLQPPPAMADPSESDAPKTPGVRRLARRIILETRQYVLRENPYYLAYISAKRLFGKQNKGVLEAQNSADSDLSSCPAEPEFDQRAFFGHDHAPAFDFTGTE